LLTTASVVAWPACDETTGGNGCIDLTGGGSGQFQLGASWDVDTQTQSGTLHYVDADAGIDVSSSTMTDYSVIDTGARGFIFEASGAGYNEVRVFIADLGDSGDQFEIQLLQDGTIVYDEFGGLSAACGGGITITSACDNNNPPPPPPPPPTNCHPGHPQPPPPKCPPGKDHPQHPEHPQKPECSPGSHHIHGNNGVGNGIDPQPPGNPPINDGPETGPGHPGNRGGAHKK
jgi:hypothetical protein